jgi:two-component system cell cycle response regulator
MLQTSAPTRTVRIVVAEHNASERQMICQVLKAVKNFIVEDAPNQAALMARLAHGDVDCVTIDRMIGPDSGFDVAERIRSRLPEPPAFVMLVGASDELTATKAFRCGFSDYVKKKSLSSRELINAIVHAVERRDVASRQRAELEQLAKLALRDRLTGLPNRTLIEERLLLLIAGAKRHGKPFAVLKIDVNGLKSINDSFGLAVGDTALRAFADRLKEISRASDFFGRIGDDEFLYLTDHGVSPELMNRARDRLTRELAFSIELESVGLNLSASVGAALFPIDGKTQSEILGAADRAMQAAKASAAAAPVDASPAEDASRSEAADAEPMAGVLETILVGSRAESGTPMVARPMADAAAAPAHRYENRRSARRNRVLKRGMMVVNDGYSTINCLIRDLSTSGARVTTEDEYMGTDKFSLVIMDSGRRLPAEMRWQRGRELGVRFLQ